MKRVGGFLNSIRRMYRKIRMTAYTHLFGYGGISSSFFVSKGCDISKDFISGSEGFLGKHCQIGPKVRFGDYVMFGPGVRIVGGDHVYQKAGVPIIFSGRPILNETIIESDVWVGANAIIMSGVRIGRGSIVAAGSIVTRNLESYGVYAGIPAVKIKDRFASKDLELVHDLMLDGPLFVGEYCGRHGQ